MALAFFDQNVMEKLSKKGKDGQNKAFQNNVGRLLETQNQLLTSFALLEFAGCNSKKILDIQYKNKSLEDYLFQSAEELKKLPDYLRDQLKNKIPKSYLIKKLEKKKEKDKLFLTVAGFDFIDHYIDYIKNTDFMYESLIKLLLLDRLAIVKLPTKDKDKNYIRGRFIDFLTYIVIKGICQEGMVNYRMILELLCNQLRHVPSTQEDPPEINKTAKDLLQIYSDQKLKKKGDLVDCEIIPLAFLGWRGSKCHIYTTDDENTIIKRLTLCCCYISSTIPFILNKGILSKYIKANDLKLFSQIEKSERPKLNFGKVFILDKKTGEKINEISAEEMHNNREKLVI